MFFIVTANTLDTIPRPLLDRLEMIRLSGSRDEEKVEIAKRYLVPRQLNETGLAAEQSKITDETVRQVISGYTREAGVRQLYRRIGNVARKIAMKIRIRRVHDRHGFPGGSCRSPRPGEIFPRQAG